MTRLTKAELVRLREAAMEAEREGRESPEVLLERLLELAPGATAAGVRSPWLHWRLSVAYDVLKRPELAFDCIEKALALDPLAPPFQASFEVIVKNLCRKLQAVGAAEAGPLYDRLARAGVADEESHLAMARHLATLSDLPGALRLLGALVVLSPASRPAWEELARIARLAGDAETACAAEVEASMLPGPLGSPVVPSATA